MPSFENQTNTRVGQFDAPTPAVVIGDSPVTPVMAALPEQAPPPGVPEAQLDHSAAHEKLDEPKPTLQGDTFLVGGATVRRGTDGLSVTFAGPTPENALRQPQYSTELTQGDRKVLVVIMDSRAAAESSNPPDVSTVKTDATPDAARQEEARDESSSGADA